MARIFVRLRLRLLSNSLTGSTGQVVGLVFGALGATIVAVGGFAVTAASRAGDGADVVAVLVATSLVLGWITFPLIGFGSGTSIDPQTLVALPLRRRPMMAGLGAAALIGPGAAITAAIMAGCVLGLVDGVAGVVPLVLGAVLQLVLCVVLSRALTTFLGGALRSRRGRDLRILALFVIVLLPQTLRFFLPHTTDIAALRNVTDWLAWVPFTWPTRAMVGVQRGEWLLVAGLLVASVAVCALLVAWWGSSLDRTLTRAEAGKPGRVRETGPVADPLYGRALRWLPRSATGAVAARELRLSWRDPRRRVALISSILLPFIVAGAFLTGGGIRQQGAVYLCVLVVVLGGGKAFNQLGVDGRAWTVHEAVGSDLRRDLDGKAVATAAIQLVEVLVVAAVLAVPGRGWSQLPAAVLFAVALSGPQLGLGNLCSVHLPIPAPTKGANLFATSSPGDGCLAGLLVLVAMVALVVISAPFLVGALLLPGAWARLGLAVVALPCGFVLYRLLTDAAARWARVRRPEILVRLAPSVG